MTGRFAFADGLRGLAAFWVVLFHLKEGHHIDSLTGALPTFADRIIFDFGHFGVAIFFVLSGFVMAVAVESVRLTRKTAPLFVIKRFVRLVPAYYFAIALALIAVLTKNRFEFTSLPDFSVLATHLLLVQGIYGVDNINIVFWTLCIEIQFYIAFAAIVFVCDQISAKKSALHVTQRRRIAVFALAFLSVSWPLGLIESTLWRGSFWPYWYSFLLGSAVWFSREGAAAQKLPILILIIIVGLVGVRAEDGFALVSTITAFLLFFALEIGKQESWLNFKLIQFFGAISYPLYLLHNNSIGATFRFMKSLGYTGVLYELIASVITLFVCLTVAYACTIALDNYAIKTSRKIALK